MPKGPQEAGRTGAGTQNQGMWTGPRECWWLGKLDRASSLRGQGPNRCELVMKYV